MRPRPPRKLPVTLSPVNAGAAWVPDGVLKLRRVRELNQKQRSQSRSARMIVGSAFAAFLMIAIFAVHARAVPSVVAPVYNALPVKLAKTVAVAPPAVWEVEQRPGSTVYSNGLEIRNEFETTSRPRSYHTFSRLQMERSAEAFGTPAGIVFHTTESLLLPNRSGGSARTDAYARRFNPSCAHRHALQLRD